MNIKAKYKPGDTIFYMESNSVRTGVISTISTVTKIASTEEVKNGTSCKTKTEVKYGLLQGLHITDSTDKWESQLFPSKSALLKSL